jgi:hypothetical protein
MARSEHSFERLGCGMADQLEMQIWRRRDKANNVSLMVVDAVAASCQDPMTTEG